VSLAFNGVPKGTIAFLGELAQHNEKPWFDAHRDDYERDYVGAGREIVDAIGPRLGELTPEVRWDAKVGGSIGRIYRDVRFSADKRPYKDHLDLWFWTGPEKCWDHPGFFMRITHDRAMLGCGMHKFEKDQLASFRAAVVADDSGAELAGIVGKLDGVTFGEAERKGVPRGFPKDHPRAELLRHDSLHAGYDGPHPKGLHTAKFADWAIERFAAAWPIGEWILANVVKS
jgi:uncharacterized protein (TIGR02453 family)